MSVLPSGGSRPDLLKQKTLKELKKDLEMEYLVHLFRETRGDSHKMAESLEVNQSTLYRWFRRLEIDIHALRREM